LPATQSVALKASSGRCYITVDSDALAARELKVHLAHELGHCATDSFYRRHMPAYCRGQLENRADRWAYERLTPAADIQAALDAGIREPWELAERFGVTDEFMAGALRYYTETRGVRFLAGE
jgi:Zn-dependent peptidase ImmA (M78 family)